MYGFYGHAIALPPSELRASYGRTLCVDSLCFEFAKNIRNIEKERQSRKLYTPQVASESDPKISNGASSLSHPDTWFIGRKLSDNQAMSVYPLSQ